VADWYGSSDLRRLQNIYGATNIAVVRLLGLTRDEAAVFLRTRGISDPHHFLREAEERGLDDLLENPNDLILLATIASDGWPETRRELFERSSKLLVREQNEDHARQLRPMNDDDLLDTAGIVCSSLLISGTEEICLDAIGYNAERASINSFAADPAIVRRVAKSGLFMGEASRNVKPRHRTTAEFLSARWLARSVSSGRLTLRRVLALLAADERPPTALRGVFAWLVTLLPVGSVHQLIDIDPFGLLMYGDASSFDDRRLEMLLSALEAAAAKDPYFRVNAWNDRPWLVFAKSSLATNLSRVLTSPTSNAHLLDGIVGALRRGPLVLGSASALHTMIRNQQGPTELRLRAIRALVNQSDTNSELLSLYNDCESKRLADVSGRFRIEIFRYCHRDISGTRFGRTIAELWDQEDVSIGALHEGYLGEVPTTILADTLDYLAHEQERRGDRYAPGKLSPFHCAFEIRYFLGMVLMRALNQGLASIERLAMWRRLFGDRQHIIRENEWAETWQKLNEDGRLIIHIFENEVIPGSPHALFKRYVQAISEFDDLLVTNSKFVRYMIERAGAEVDDDVATAIASCVSGLWWRSDGANELLELAWIKWSERPGLKQALHDLGYWEIPDWRFNHAARSIKARKSREQKLRETQRAINDRLEGIRSWSDFGILEFVGRVYFFGSDLITHVSRDGKPRRLLEYVDLLGPAQTESLAESLVIGLKLGRLPSPRELGEWRRDGTRYSADFAALAALELLQEREPSFELDDHTARSLAIMVVREWGITRATVLPKDGHPGGWFWTICEKKPALVAQALMEFVGASAKAGGDAYDFSAILDRLKGLPVALNFAKAVLFDVRPENLDSLGTPLRLLFDVGANETVGRLAFTRLNESTLPEKRAFWSATGWMADSATFADDLKIALSAIEPGVVWRAIRTICPESHTGPFRKLGHSQIASLIQMIGSRFPRMGRPRGVTTGSSNPWDASEIVEILISSLASDDSEASSHILSTLAQIETIKSYRDELLHALAIQRVRRRDREFVPAQLDDVTRAFKNEGVISAEDVVAVALDELFFLQDQYQGGDTTGWRKFWNTGSRGVITNPRIEDHCRDILLDDWRPRLSQFGLTINAATPASGGNEADASIQSNKSGQSIRIPLEMKMEHNSEVWSAIRDQLSRKYMIDPAAHGLGIFIVFWTGDFDGRIPRPPNGIPRPTSSNEMAIALSSLLSDEERKQIPVVVLDVAKPTG
jgi:hypothetical protein